MKKIHLTLVLLFAMAFAKAQIVSFPDINFKLKLLSANTTTNQIAKNLAGNWTVIDTNNDGLIQQSEANNISYLNIGDNNPYANSSSNNNITNYTGINNFLNLKKLYIGNELTNYVLPLGVYGIIDIPNGFDFSSLVNLEELIISHVAFSNINLTNCVNLKKIWIGSFSMYAPNLFGLSMGSGPNSDYQNYSLNSIDFSNKPLLEEIHLSHKWRLSNINISNSNNIKEVEIIDCSLDILDISNLVSLQKLILKSSFEDALPNNGTISSFNFTNNPLLEEINFTFRENINNIIFGNNINLKFLKCENNSLTSIDLTQLTNLQLVNFKNNDLTNLSISSLPLLSSIDVSNNQLTSLDLSSCANLQSVNCDNNNLEYISFKNNTNETKTFLNNPNLTYICADEAEQQSVQYIVNVYEMWDTCVVGDYCSFTPNGNYNTISGNALYDNENDGCDINDEVFQFLRVNLNDGTNSGSTFTNFEGDYTFYTNSGNFTLTPQLENPTYFNVSPATTQISFTNANNNTASQDFCITPNGIHNDLEIVIAPTTPARPGFDAVYEIVYKNKGNQPLSGDIVFTFDDAKLDFVSASQMPTQATGSLTWSFTNLLPFENKNITLTLNTNGPMETPAVNNGDVLTFNATISPITGDEIPEDNVFLLKQIVVGSYDPNDITCIEGEVVAPSQIGQFLHYVVRFENTGTAAAENVVVKTEINPAEFDMATLQALNASHNVYTRIKDNKVEFIFEDIQLAGSPAGGHGHVVFKIKSKTTLQTNDMVTNNANIFFDYNFPIETNDATTTFATLNNQDFTKDNSVKVYPNPTKSMVNINCNSNIKSIELYDVQGRLLQVKTNGSNSSTLDISDKTNGIYFVKITTENGSKVEKIVKE